MLLNYYKPFLTLIFSLISLNLFSQLITVNFDEVIKTPLKFNQDFIYRNKIKKIKSNYSSKRENEIIKDLKLFEVYEFDSLGKIINFTSNKSTLGKDTISYEFRYKSINDQRPFSIIIKDHYGFYRNDFELDEHSRVILEKQTRFNLNNNREIIIKNEAYSFDTINSNIAKISYNSKNRPYKTEVFISDSLGYLKSIKHTYNITNRSISESFNYNEKGWVSCYTKHLKGTDLKEEYVYDVHDNIIYKNDYQNNFLKKKTEYMYNEYLLLFAEIKNNFSEKLIEIVKYKYEYFD